MTQSRRHSFAEACANVAVGYFVALATQLVVFPALEIPVRLSQNVVIGAIFTAVSLTRSYVLRRAFNRWHRRAIRRELDGNRRIDYTGAPGEEIYFGGLKFLISEIERGVNGVTKIALTRY